jgi:hypothetical protein
LLSRQQLEESIEAEDELADVVSEGTLRA